MKTVKPRAIESSGVTIPMMAPHDGPTLVQRLFGSKA